ncbi:MAG TPA: phosphoserine phosphatase SerB [Acidimicrobiia bacterium]|nr:phosphoserine phosphatase SerB [Acidimicrobiia bacterium]
MEDGRKTLLVTVTGRDRPGITSSVFGALEGADIEVLDVEQVVIRGRLVLGVLVTVGDDEGGLRAQLDSIGDWLGMEIEIASGGDESGPRAGGTLHVSVLGHPLRPAAVAAVATRLAARGANIERINRLSRWPVTTIELQVSGADDPERLRTELAAEASAGRFDIAVQPGGLHRRGRRLVVMDVDSTLIPAEVIELLADHAGAGEEVRRVTEAAMRGELDFEASLRRRVALLEGLPVSAVDEVRRAIVLTPGARTLIRTLRRLDHEVGIVSGGFTQVTDSLVAKLGIHYSAANTLEIVDGRLTGRLVGPIVDRAGKAAALERFAEAAGVPLAQTVAIGDGANDLDMIARAGLGVAFNAKPLVRQAADAALNVPYLDALLYLLGISREEVEAADAEEGLPVRPPGTTP